MKFFRDVIFYSVARIPAIRRTRLMGLLMAVMLWSFLSTAGWTAEPGPKTSAPERPNVLLVVADDLGTFDIGVFGSEIRTPNIDSLAQQGLMFTDFHTSATCSPTRSMLLSGVDSHAAGVGNMIEHVSPNQRGQQGYEGHLSDRVVTVATLLQDNGYATYMAGKWHLGRSDELLPVNRGFDESFVLLEGGASYFNDMMGLVSVAKNASYRRNQQVVNKLPDDFYATEYYADFIIDQLDAREPKNQPFFAYLALTAPHWPLQVKDEHVDLYKGRYDKGYESLLEERLHAAVKLGVIPEDTPTADWPPHVVPWDKLSDEQQKVEAKTMEVYAAVIERMDFHIGRVLDYLDESGNLENTLVVFMSDNGPDGSDRSKLPGNDKWLPEAWDLSYENIGKKGSYVYPGPGWARTSAGPYEMYKEFLSQGGIKTPLILSYPEIKNKGDQIDEFTTVKDITPTILDFTNTMHPGSEYRGRAVVALEGISLISHPDEGIDSSSDEYLMGWELFGQRALRKGDWKLLWLTNKPGWLVNTDNADQWRLFNLATDPAETNNLVSQEPEKFAEMLALWQQYSDQQSVILPHWGD